MSQPTSTSTRTRRELSAWRNAVFVIFILSGLSLATWVARIPGIRDDLGLGKDPAAIGLLILGLSIGSIVGLTASSPILLRFGPHRGMVAALAIVSVGMLSIGFGSTVFHAVPLVAIGSIVTAAAYGDWDVLPAVVGVNVCIILTGLGLSSLASALVPYGAPRPGDSAFAQPQHTGGAATAAQVFSLLLTAAFAGVPVWMLVLGVLHDPAWFGTCLLAGVGVGVVVLVLGVWLGAVAYNRRGPEIMSFALRNA